MNDYFNTYATLVFHDNKNFSRYQFDFMILVHDNIEYPFINIYYFPDYSLNHEHYIINIEGNLEICHDNLTDDYYKKKTNNTINVIFKVLFYNLSSLTDKKILNVSDKDIVLSYKFKDNEIIKFQLIAKKFNEYNFLINHAISKYSNINYNKSNIRVLLTVIKSLKNELPKSNKKVKKKSIIKRKK